METLSDRSVKGTRAGFPNEQEVGGAGVKDRRVFSSEFFSLLGITVILFALYIGLFLSGYEEQGLKAGIAFFVSALYLFFRSLITGVLNRYRKEPVRKNSELWTGRLSSSDILWMSIIGVMVVVYACHAGIGLFEAFLLISVAVVGLAVCAEAIRKRCFKKENKPVSEIKGKQLDSNRYVRGVDGPPYTAPFPKMHRKEKQRNVYDSPYYAELPSWQQGLIDNIQQEDQEENSPGWKNMDADDWFYALLGIWMIVSLIVGMVAPGSEMSVFLISFPFLLVFVGIPLFILFMIPAYVVIRAFLSLAKLIG